MPDPRLAIEGVFADAWEPLGDGMAPWSFWANSNGSHPATDAAAPGVPDENAAGNGGAS
jgi:hypothetical protein